MRINRTSILWTTTLALVFMAQACNGSGGQLAGEDIEFTSVEALCDGDGKKMSIILTADVSDSETAKEIVRLEIDLDAITLGEEVDLAVLGGGAVVTYAVVGPREELPERMGDSGVRVLDGTAVSGTLTVDEASCEEPASASGAMDAELATSNGRDNFAVDVSFATD